MSGSEREAWYRRWFGEEYLRLYPHRDREEAGRAVALFRSAADLSPGDRILDLACGAGRHLAHLAGCQRAVGLDLSAPLVRRARDAVPEAAGLVRGDMRRLPFSEDAFAGATLFFTSFGYFADPDDDRRVLAELLRILRPGGALLLDVMNASRVRRDLVPEDVREVAGRRVRQRRRIRDGVVVKRIEIEDPGPPGSDGPASRVYHERVRLYEPDALEGILREEGFHVRRRYGDYDGSDHGAASPRLLVLARAGGRP